MSIYLASRGVEAVGMNKGGRFEAAGIGLTMVHAEHSGGVTITGGEADVTRDLGCWGWLLEFEDGTRVYHTGDTDLFGDMALVKDRWSPSITVLPIGGHYTMASFSKIYGVHTRAAIELQHRAVFFTLFVHLFPVYRAQVFRQRVSCVQQVEACRLP